MPRDATASSRDPDRTDQLAGQLLFPLKGERKPPGIRATPEEFDLFIVTLKERIKQNDRPE
jgi:hypothetical protein